MERTGRGFTLIELLMVMLIIGIVITMLMKIGPEVSRNIKVYQTKNFLHVLDLGVARYKRMYGTYPPDGSSPTHNVPFGHLQLGSWGCGEPGCFYLYVALMGPDSFGWTTADHDVAVEFGPFLEAGVAGTGQRYDKPCFTDLFNNEIHYYRAKMANELTLNATYLHQNRYNPQSSAALWGRQRDAAWVGMWHDWTHFYKKLTAATLDTPNILNNRIPYHADSYIIWSAGADEKFGYWYYSPEHQGLMRDLQMGVCDDITNFD